jgi:hypothetical protein
MTSPEIFATFCYYFPLCGQNYTKRKGSCQVKIVLQNRLFSTIFKGVNGDHRMEKTEFVNRGEKSCREGLYASGEKRANAPVSGL